MYRYLQRLFFSISVVGILVLVPKEQQHERFVVGLASSSSARNEKSSPNQSQSKGRGFGSGSNPNVEPKRNVNDDESQNEEEEIGMAKQTVRSLFSVTSHIQNPELYTPPWTQACHFTDGSSSSSSSSIVSSQDAPNGTILTAFPIHALGLRFLASSSASASSSSSKDTEFITYDADRDGEYFKPDNPKPGLRMKLNIPLEANQPAAGSIFFRDGDRKHRVMFAMTFRDEVVPGWFGNRVKSSGSDKVQSSNKANCVMIPLPGAAPLCAVVATRDLLEGEELFQWINPETKIVQECKELLATTYQNELSELQEYIRMACKA
mmetsp:Transcript_2563/g.5570  ORF Transcript_2563/g.5570 Transcript_2563/m.5570 type:complete len:321 (+) Transcript_2563:97-1059(+)